MAYRYCAHVFGGQGLEARPRFQDSPPRARGVGGMGGGGGPPRPYITAYNVVNGYFFPSYLMTYGEHYEKKQQGKQNFNKGTRYVLYSQGKQNKPFSH